jgi:TRAP-type C4-dicarboxylate transport system permease small subunit
MQPPDQAESPAIPAPALLRRFDAVLNAIDSAVSFVVIVSMAVLTTVICVQVFFRYVLNDSLDWGWDVPRLCFIWVVLLSIPLGLKHSVHVGIDLIVEHLSFATRRLIHRVNAVLMTGLMIIVAYYAVQLAERTWDQMMPGIALSVGLFYVAMIISAAHSILHLIRLAWTGIPPVSQLSES